MVKVSSSKPTKGFVTSSKQNNPSVSKTSRNLATSKKSQDTNNTSKRTPSPVEEPESEDEVKPEIKSIPVAAKTTGARQWDKITPSLNEGILKTLRQFNFTTMTPVQSAAIPSFLQYKDVCVQAVTGSGKTLAFVIPILEMLCRRKASFEKLEVGAIILSPTRELAKQITTVIQDFLPNIFEATGRQLYVSQCVGGQDMSADLAQLAQHGANIIVATPGRLESVLTNQRILNVRNLECLVLDEADRLLDLGFQVSLNNILKYLPKQRRTGLFSATLTEEVEQLIKVGLRNPVKITVRVQFKQQQLTEQEKNALAKEDAPVQTHQSIPTTLRNYYSIVSADDKLFHLVDFLKEHQREKVIIFFLTCACVDYFYRVLATYPELANIFAPFLADGKKNKSLTTTSDGKVRPIMAPMHGKMPQQRRNNVYQAFREAECGALLCTDVAARGIDIPEVDWILQFDAPQNPDFFIHRIGRAARAGKSGAALIYLLNTEETFINFLAVKNVPIRQLEISKISEEQRNVVWSPVVERYYSETNEIIELPPLPSINREEISQVANMHKDFAATVKVKQLKQKRRTREERQEEKRVKLQEDLLRRKTKLELAKITQLPYGHKARLSKKEANYNIVHHARYLISQDRHMFNLAANAFVCFVRAYKEHRCQHIFILSDLPYRSLALGFGLLYLPQLPDLRKFAIKFPILTRVMPNSIPYLDKAREIQREQLDAEKRIKNEAEKAARLSRAEETKVISKFKEQQREKKSKTRKKKTWEEYAEEWEELDRETRALKKLRRKKITEDEYDDIVSGKNKKAKTKKGKEFFSDTDSDEYISDDETPRTSVYDKNSQKSKSQKRYGDDDSDDFDDLINELTDSDEEEVGTYNYDESELDNYDQIEEDEDEDGEGEGVGEMMEMLDGDQMEGYYEEDEDMMMMGDEDEDDGMEIHDGSITLLERALGPYGLTIEDNTEVTEPWFSDDEEEEDEEEEEPVIIQSKNKFGKKIVAPPQKQAPQKQVAKNMIQQKQQKPTGSKIKVVPMTTEEKAQWNLIDQNTKANSGVGKRIPIAILNRSLAQESDDSSDEESD